MARRWVLNCDIDNHKHGFVAEEEIVVRLFFQKSKSAKTPEVFLAEVKRHLLDDVKDGFVRTEERDGKPGYRLRFAYDARDGRVYIQASGSSIRAVVATVPQQYR